jgi:hypothetical protein
MPFVSGDLIVPTFGRQVYVVIGPAPNNGFLPQFRALSHGLAPTEVIVANIDADVSFTWFILAFAVAPAGKPPVGSRVAVQASPLALFGGVPVALAPITQPGIRGIVHSYWTIPTFPGPVYATVVTPETNLMLCQIDELSLSNAPP